MNYLYNDIEEFNKPQINDLYKEIQNEIKDKVITKLLLTVQNQYKELMILKQENISLKSHLTYILKRILLNKNEYNNNNLYKNNIYDTPFKLNNSLFNINSRNKSNKRSFKHVKSVENNRTKLDNNIVNHNLNRSINEGEYTNEKINKNKIDKKVQGCLNSMYRNNFLKSRNVISNNLNKKETIYKELFPSDQKNFKTINNEESFIREKIDNSVFELGGNIWDQKEKNIHIIKKVNPKKSDKTLKIKNYNEEQIKDIYFDFNINENNDLDKKHIKKQGNNINKNMKNNYGDKIRAKKELLYIKRSPFLVNKY